MTPQKFIQRVGRRLGYSQADIQYLLNSDAEHAFEIVLNNGNKHQAYRVQHKNLLGPYKGGIRFHPEVNLEEVRALATLMSLKTAAAGLPLGGGKGGVAVDAKKLTKSELEELSRAYVRGLLAHIGPDKDVPAPDVSTNAEVMDWMVDEYQTHTGDTSRASFTGKSTANGGSEGREAATGRGGVIVLKELLKLTGRTGSLSYAVQGFGNVGSFFATSALELAPEWSMSAATDSSGGIVNPWGLDVKALDDYKKAGNRLSDYADTQLNNQELITQEVDVLVLAALGGVITKQNADQVRAKIILELANGPVDDEAHEYLSTKGIIVVPDILANAGGVVVSYLEWLQNKADQRWTENRVNTELERYLISATRKIYTYHQQTKCSLKEAAFAVAIRQIMEAKERPNGR